MNFLKRALSSITRRKSKTVLLFLIVFILGNIIAGAVSIKEASKSVEKDIKMRLGAVATIVRDHDTLLKEHENMEYDDQGNPIGELPRPGELTPEILRTIGSSKYVKEYDFSLSAHLMSRDVKPWIPKGIEEKSIKSFDDHYGFSLSGVENTKFFPVIQGSMKLIDGRVFSQNDVDSKSYVVLITKELAEANNYKVGDSVILKQLLIGRDDDLKRETNSEYKPKIVYEEDIAFNIIGIIEDAEKKLKIESKARPGSGKQNDPYLEMYKKNRLYSLNNIIIDINRNLIKKMVEYEIIDKDDASNVRSNYQPIYIIKDPTDVDRFVNETNPILPKYNIVDSASNEYKKIAGPIEKSTKMANYVLVVSVVSAILIISLVIMLFLRDRKHEFGIYLSLGEKRSKVIRQILIEVLLIAFVAIVISIFTGNIIASSLQNKVVVSSNEKHQSYNTGYDSIYSDMRSENLSEEDVLDSYKIKLSIGYIATFMIISLVTVIFATALPMMYIVRLNPKKIMM